MLDHCAVPDCTGGKSDSQPLFRFPLDSERCQQWVEKCQREDLLQKPAEQLYKYERICGKHFEPSVLENVVLKDDAIPTIFESSATSQGKRKVDVKANEKELKGRKKLKEPEPQPANDTQPVPEEDPDREYLKSLFEIFLVLHISRVCFALDFQFATTSKAS
uniref:THAP domain-containing protein 1 n=1 Tax=Knipowitschia caucasica TaxID=637954 RepID=A0AAV2J8K4_KNICA